MEFLISRNRYFFISKNEFLIIGNWDRFLRIQKRNFYIKEFFLYIKNVNFLITWNGLDWFFDIKNRFSDIKKYKINSKMAPHIPTYLRPSVLMRIRLSDFRADWLSGCRTIGPSEYKAVTSRSGQEGTVRTESQQVSSKFMNSLRAPDNFWSNWFLGVKKNMFVSSDPTDPNFLLRP